MSICLGSSHSFGPESHLRPRSAIPVNLTPNIVNCLGAVFKCFFHLIEPVSMMFIELLYSGFMGQVLIMLHILSPIYSAAKAGSVSSYWGGGGPQPCFFTMGAGQSGLRLSASISMLSGLQVGISLQATKASRGTASRVSRHIFFTMSFVPPLIFCVQKVISRVVYYWLSVYAYMSFSASAIKCGSPDRSIALLRSAIPRVHWPTMPYV